MDIQQQVRDALGSMLALNGFKNEVRTPKTAPTQLERFLARIDSNDRQGAVDVYVNAGMIPPDGLINLFLASRQQSTRIRNQLERLGARADAADPAVAAVGLGVYEEFRKIIAVADQVPFADTPCIDNLPIVGPEAYPYGADDYIRQIVRAVGTPEDATGEDFDFPLVSVSSQPAAVTTTLKKLGWNYTWQQQQRQKVSLMGWDPAAMSAEGCRSILGQQWHEDCFIQGEPARGKWGLCNHPSIQKYSPNEYSYGTSKFQDWTQDATGFYRMWIEVNAFLRELRGRLPLIGRDIDTLMVPKWFDTLSNQTILQLGTGSDFPFRTLKEAIMSSNPWLKKWLVNSRLDAIDPVTGLMDTDANGQPTPLSNGRIIACTSAPEVFHFVQPISFQELAPFQKGPSTVLVGCYASNGGVFVGRPQQIGSMIC